MAAAAEPPTVVLWFSSAARARTRSSDAACAYANIPVLRATRDLTRGVSVDLRRIMADFTREWPPALGDRDDRMMLTALVTWPYDASHANCEWDEAEQCLRTTRAVDEFAVLVLGSSDANTDVPTLRLHIEVDSILRHFLQCYLLVHRAQPPRKSATATDDRMLVALSQALCSGEQVMPLREQLALLRFAKVSFDAFRWNYHFAPMELLRAIWRGASESHFSDVTTTTLRQPPSLYEDERQRMLHLAGDVRDVEERRRIDYQVDEYSLSPRISDPDGLADAAAAAIEHALSQSLFRPVPRLRSTHRF